MIKLGSALAVIRGIPKERREFIVPTRFGSPKIRLRFRNNDWARAFLKYPDGIRHFLIADNGTNFYPDHEQGSNWRPANAR